MKTLLQLVLSIVAVAQEATAQDVECVRERAAMVETIRAYARSDASVFGQQGLSERVLEAMAQTKRHLFIPKRSCSIAYADRPFPTPALRTRSNVSDVAFVEFAVDQTHADGLAELFRALGFKLMGLIAPRRWSVGPREASIYL
jgi:hypothetical protein